jgi:acyl carrier protein
MQKIREIIAEILDDDLETTDTETTVELNFALLKFK